MSRTSLLVMSCALLLVARTASAQSFDRPSDLIYCYEANEGQDVAGDGSSFDALDGTFSHNNGSDAWDGSRIGEGSPGGAMVIDGTYLRMQETGNPTRYGMPDPSNRKIYLGHNLTADGASDTLLDDGVTLYFRARVPTDGPVDDLHPDDGSGIVPYPAGGDGYTLHNGGKGNVGIKQLTGGLISMSLDTASGLRVNGLADVDGTTNILDIDVTQWHDYYVTISAGGAGTHQVSVYVDGSSSPTTYDVTSGGGSDFSDMTYVAIGMGATGESGALDLDFVCVAPGIQAPGGAPAAPVPLSSGWGIALLGLLIATGAFFAFRRRLAVQAC